MNPPVALAADAEPTLGAEVEEVRVTGKRDPVQEASPTRSSVDRERLAQPGMRLGEALRVVPGVSVRDTGGYGAFASASLRGGTAAQTPVYFGSVLLNDDVAGTADLSAFSPALLERVDVYRGHAPLTLERQGLGGAIVLVPRVPRERVLEGGLTAGSLGHVLATLTGGDSGDAGEIIAMATHERAANRYPFRDDRGTLFDARDDAWRARENADTARTSAVVSARSNVGPASVRFLGFGTRGAQGVPRLAVLPSIAARLEQGRELAALEVHAPAGDHTVLAVRATGTWARSQYDDPLAELGLGTPSLALTGSRYEQRVALDHQAEHWRLFGSVGALEEALLRRGGEELDATRLTGRVHGGASFDVSERWRLETVLTHDGVATTASGRTVTEREGRDGVTQGRLVVRFREGVHEALLVGARYARMPTLGERYGVDGATRGNADLQPESGEALELVGRSSFGPERLVRVEVATYVRRMRDLIDYTKTSPGTVKPINVGTARLLGAEATLEVKPSESWSLGGVSTLLDAQDTTAGSSLENRRLPFRARHVESVFVRLSPVFGHRRALRFEWRTNVEGERTVDPAGLARIPAQRWSDASLRGTAGALELAVRFGNVFDEPRVDVVGYPLPGRTVDLTLAGALP